MWNSFFNISGTSFFDNLCGPKFKDACTLELRNIVESSEVIIDGKKKKVVTLKPIATAIAEYKAGQDAGSGSGSDSGNQGGNIGGGGDNGGSQTGDDD